MESLIIAFISLLILLPVLYFLPLGFSVKGKVFIVVGSFLTGLFGLVASKVFPLWQTGLILLLFVIAIAYLLNKRGENWLYLAEAENDPFSDIQEQPKVKTSEIKDTYTHIAFSDNMQKDGEAKQHVFSGKNKEYKLSLEKLIPENEMDLALFPKSEDSDVLTIQEDTKKMNSPQQTPKEIKEIVEIKEDKPLTHQTVTNQNDSDQSKPDLEALLDDDFIPVKEMKAAPASSEKNDSYDYMADLEKMLDLEELSLDASPRVQKEKAAEDKPKQKPFMFDLEELEEIKEEHIVKR